MQSEICAVLVIFSALFCLSKAQTEAVTTVKPPLSCYTCSSDIDHPEYHKNCGDENLKFEDKVLVPKAPCLSEHNACFKFVTVYERVLDHQLTQVYNITSRLCGEVKPKQGKTEPDLEECDTKESAQGWTTKCWCGTDTCNTGDFIQASVFSVAIATVLSFVTSLML